jgi:hypothetical protein
MDGCPFGGPVPVGCEHCGDRRGHCLAQHRGSNEKLALSSAIPRTTANRNRLAPAVSRCDRLHIRRAGPKRTVEIEFITKFGYESVQFRIAGSATSSRPCISLSQVRIGYPKFNSKLQNGQQTDIAEERPDKCRVPGAGGKRLDQLAAGHIVWADVLDRGTSHGLRNGATIHHHVSFSAGHWAEQGPAIVYEAVDLGNHPDQDVRKLAYRQYVPSELSIAQFGQVMHASDQDPALQGGGA